MFVLLWIAIFMMMFLLPLSVFSMRWGAPWPYAYRQRVRRYDGAETVRPGEPGRVPLQAGDPWWIWADILWFVLIGLMVWAVIAFLF